MTRGVRQPLPPGTVMGRIGLSTGAPAPIPLTTLAQLIAQFIGTSPAGTAAAGALSIVNNLSDLSSVSAARTNLGVGSIASLSSPLPVANGGTGTTAAGATAANNIGALAEANNLSDLANAGTARTNLGLGTLATLNSPVPVANGGTGQTAAGATAANAIGALAEASNLSDLANAGTARTNLGLGTLATLSTASLTANVTGVLPVANGGTNANAAGATAAANIGALAVANNLSDVTAATARTNLGLGSMATQAATAVAITGGAVDGTTIGATTASSVKATTVAASSTATATSFAPTGSAAPANGMYLPAANTVGIAAGSGLVASFSTSQGSIFGASGGTVFTVGTPAHTNQFQFNATDGGAATLYFNDGSTTICNIGSGQNIPLAFLINNAEKARFSVSNGNFLINTTVDAGPGITFQNNGTTQTRGARADTSYSYQTPATGFTITIGNSVYTLILEPAGALLTGTITMPAAPTDGQVVRITCTQNITTLTVSPSAGQSIKNAPTGFTVSLTGDQGYEFIYRLANTTWYRLQ